ncbi:ABC transporter substrate-binding protein [Pelagibacterium limicola]|uniref:ABC transporter substrate-binding protein n=1 Tax=Pelagibacterium limicola TaxID=2791022 RepID=UPI0018B01103|nr:ABC transporter substrate-binding protein [Pelagibacterium limicola]
MTGNFRRRLITGVAVLASLATTLMLTGPAFAEGKTLTVRFYDDPAGFDPANIFRIENENIAFNIFSGLTTYDGETGAIIPDLATSWQTADNKTWTFQLREGVIFQKGYGEFTAADVIYSFNRIMDPATASPYAAELAGIVSMEAPDPYTIIIELDAPNGNFLHTVANYHQGQIVSQKAIEDAGDQVRWQPVGTGPYYLESIDVSSQIVLKRFEDYYMGPAPIETIVFNIIKDEATATIALRNGEVDLVMRANREENLETLAAEGFTMNTVTDYAVVLAVLNPEFEPFSNPLVRRAMAHAVDYVSITQAISPSLTQPHYSMLLPWMDVYTDDIPKYEYDPELARSLLTEAGYPDGFTFKNLGTSAQGVTELQQFQIDFLSQAGINMEMELVDTPTFNQRRNAGDFDLASRLLPAVNPDMILFSYLHPDNMVPNGLNGARYDNPEVTELLEAARAEPDKDKAFEMYKQVQQIVATELPYLPTYSNNVFWPGKPEVTGVNINYLAQVNFYDVDIEE